MEKKSAYCAFYTFIYLFFFYLRNNKEHFYEISTSFNIQNIKKKNWVISIQFCKPIFFFLPFLTSNVNAIIPLGTKEVVGIFL